MIDPKVFVLDFATTKVLKVAKKVNKITEKMVNGLKDKMVWYIIRMNKKINERSAQKYPISKYTSYLDPSLHSKPEAARARLTACLYPLVLNKRITELRV